MTTTYQESARTIPVARAVDVLVVGGGTAGVCAAIAAARQGAKTLLVEAAGFLGGSQTGAQVCPTMPNHVDGVPLNAGIGLEIMRRAEEAGCGWTHTGQPWFDPEMLKAVLDEMVLERGRSSCCRPSPWAPSWRTGRSRASSSRTSRAARPSSPDG